MLTPNRIKKLAATKKKWSLRVVDKLYDTYRKSAFGVGFATPIVSSSAPIEVGIYVKLSNPIGICWYNRDSWNLTRTAHRGKILTYKIGSHAGTNLHTNEHWYYVYPSNLEGYTEPENMISDNDIDNESNYKLLLPQRYIKVLNADDDGPLTPLASSVCLDDVYD